MNKSVLDEFVERRLHISIFSTMLFISAFLWLVPLVALFLISCLDIFSSFGKVDFALLCFDLIRFICRIIGNISAFIHSNLFNWNHLLNSTFFTVIEKSIISNFFDMIPIITMVIWLIPTTVLLCLSLLENRLSNICKYDIYNFLLLHFIIPYDGAYKLI